MTLIPEEFRKVVINFHREEQKRLGVTDETGLVTQDQIDWYVLMNLLGAKYVGDSAEDYIKRIEIVGEVTQLKVSWDPNNERLIFPPHLEAKHLHNL